MVPTGNNVLAIEWDRSEFRYVWVAHASRKVHIRALGRMAMPESQDVASLPDELLADLKVLLRARGAQTIVCLARSDVEEFETTFPPADDREIAQLVSLESHKQLPSIDDNARVDYLTIEQGEDLTRRVSIVVLGGERHRQIAESVARQGWKLASIQMRHIAASLLLRRLANLNDFPRSILLSVSRSDADLIVLERDQIALVRTIPLSAEFDSDTLGEKLALEIQRSLMVTARPGHEESTGGEQVFLFGVADEQQSLASQLSAALPATVTLVDPLGPFQVRARAVPDRLHAFAGLLGSVLDLPAAQMIDLHTPKCAHAVSSWRQRAWFYGSLAATVLISLVVVSQNRLAQLEEANAALGRTLKQSQKTCDQLKSGMAVIDQVEDWSSDDINWLEELRELSQRFPERSRVQVKSMTLSSGSGSDGVISMNLRARDETVISQLEQAIRDEFHQVRTHQLNQSESDEEFPWQFGATILLQRRDREEFIPVAEVPNAPRSSGSGSDTEDGQPSPSDTPISGEGGEP
jgi:hypothetical protein